MVARKCFWLGHCQGGKSDEIEMQHDLQEVLVRDSQRSSRGFVNFPFMCTVEKTMHLFICHQKHPNSMCAESCWDSVTLSFALIVRKNNSAHIGGNTATTMNLLSTTLIAVIGMSCMLSSALVLPSTLINVVTLLTMSKEDVQ